MKKILIILSFIVSIFMSNSCVEPDIIDPGFEDMIQMSIYDYIIENKESYTSFLSILEKGNIDKTLSAYNPEGEGYTLFLPDNSAIERFIQNSNQFSSLNDLLNNKEYVDAFSRFHVVEKEVLSNDFPFGAFQDPTLSKDYLTVSFVVEEDTSYYKINNQAPVIFPDIEASNGYVHLVSEALTPITYSSYGYLELNSGFSIFKAAVDLTGFKEKIDFSLKDEDSELQPITMLVEHDSIFEKFNINSLDDLISKISPGNNDYTNEFNPLYNFVGYHLITGNFFMDDFEGEATNYSTFSDIPVNINGLGLDIAINKGKEVFDTIVTNNDTTYIDFISFQYDESNVVSQSGAIHFVNRLMTQQTPSRAIKTYQFFEEPLFNEFRRKVGSYIVEDESALYRTTWTGADLFFVKLAENSQSAWSDDYLQISGDFEISFTIPKIVQGKYSAFLGAEAYNNNNALIEVFIDGKKVGGLIDLSTGGSGNNPFTRIDLGTVDFIKYAEHTIQIKSLIPGRFLWDYIRFEPYN